MTTAMTPAYARAPRGERAVASAPGSWESVTVIAALGLDGVRAPLALPGAVDTAAFETYVEQALVPALHEGDVVVLDNLKPHRAAGVAAAIERAGARVLPLPPYSPDYTPIEEMYSKVKDVPPPGRGPDERRSLRRHRGGAEASDPAGHRRLVPGGRPVRNPCVNRSNKTKSAAGVRFGEAPGGSPAGC